MNARQILTTVGATFSTFVLVTVLVIVTLEFEFSALVGLPVGILAAIVVGTLYVVFNERLSIGVHRTVSAYAAFGVVILLLLAVSYVNLAGLRQVLTTPVTGTGGLLAAILVYVVLLLRDRESLG